MLGGQEKSSFSTGVMKNHQLTFMHYFFREISQTDLLDGASSLISKKKIAPNLKKTAFFMENRRAETDLVQDSHLCGSLKAG